MVKGMETREEERRRKISKTEKEKRDRGEKESALEGKKAVREKRRQKYNMKVRRGVNSERGKM